MKITTLGFIGCGIAVVAIGIISIMNLVIIPVVEQMVR